MSSILTNASAMTALQTLNSVSKDLATTQSRISTGLRVNEASDNAAYWSISATMRSDNKANSVVQDALGLAAGKIDTAYTGMESSIEVVDQIKEKVVLAKTASDADREKIQSEIAGLQAQLKDGASGATYAGTNLLEGDPSESFTAISSYNRAADGTVTTGEIAIDLSGTVLLDATSGGSAGILDTAGSASSTSIVDIDVTAAGSAAGFDNLLTDIETALGSMADAAANLGAAKQRIDLQTDFTDKLMDAIDRGVGQLVDADMNEESTRLQALQTQQQLGIQALSIANSNSQNILSLFR